MIICRIPVDNATPLDLSTPKSLEMSPPSLHSSVSKTITNDKKRKRRQTKIGSKPSPAPDRRRMAIGTPKKAPKGAKTNKLLLVKAEREEEAGFKNTHVTTKNLLCPICKHLMVDATVTPCCGNSFCDGCVRSLLLKSGKNTCFTCNKSVSPDDLVPYPALRWIIENYRNL